MFSPFLETVRKSTAPLWDFLTRPSSSITDPHMRRQSRLLASMLLAAMFVIFSLILFSIRTSNTMLGARTWLVFSISLMILVWVAYLLTRKGYYRFAIWALLVLSTAGIFAPALAVGGPGSYNSLFYLFTITLFACTFLPLTTAILSAGVQLILLIVFSSNLPQISAERIVSGPFSFNLFLSVFMVLLTYHQRRAAKERNDELSASEERYRIVSELISDYAYSLQITPKGELLHEWITEDSFKRVTGYTHAELDKGENVNLSLFLPEDEPALNTELDQILRNEPTSTTHRIHTKSGEIRWLHIHRLPVWDTREGRVTRFYGVAQDVTERQRAETALKESEERYRLLTETISDFVLLYDASSSKLLYMSPSYEKALGYTLDEINELEPSTRVHPDDLETATQALKQVLSGKPVEGVEYRSRTKSGDCIWLEAYSNPVKDEQGNVLQVIISARDISSRKQTEMALKASEERYRIISELISDYAYFFRINPDGTRTREWMTESVIRVTGYTPDEMPQQSAELAGIFHAGDVEKAEEDIQQLLKGQQLNREFRLRTKQGELRWLNVFRRPVWDDDHTHVIGYYGVAQDITERKQVELALQASEQRYRKISELISDYAFYTRINNDGTMIREWITDSFLRVTGYLPEELDANGAPTLFHPESLVQLEADYQRLLQGESISNDHRIITKQGTVRWLNLVRQPSWNKAHTRVEGYFGVARDVTEHKQIEAQKIKLMLEQEQFAMVGHLVDALSHDFRTALATIETSRYLTERLVGDAVRPIVQPKLESIQRAVNHLATQLEHLHMVSFLAGPSLTECNLNYIVSCIITDQGGKAAQKHVNLVFKADDGMPIIRIDAVKIEKAIRHLVANALTHTPDNGTVTIYTRHTADHAIIEVQDSGTGIVPEVIERIFEPFFRGDTARTVDKGGVGLGLTIVKMIVEAHGGTVIAHSLAGMGSIFVLSLPLKEEIAVSA